MSKSNVLFREKKRVSRSFLEFYKVHKWHRVGYHTGDNLSVKEHTSEKLTRSPEENLGLVES